MWIGLLGHTMQMQIVLRQFVQLGLGQLQLFLGHFAGPRMRCVSRDLTPQLYRLPVHRKLAIRRGILITQRW